MRYVAPVTLYTKLDAECDKLAMVVDQSNVTMVDVRATTSLVTAEFWTEFHREVP